MANQYDHQETDLATTSILNIGGSTTLKVQTNKQTQSEDECDVLDTVLVHVGEIGTYQKWLFVAMLPFGMFFAFIYFVQMFIAATPQNYWCKIPELQHLDVEVRRNLSVPGIDSADGRERCFTYRANWSDVASTMTRPAHGTPLVPCEHGWEFELKDIPYPTVVSERGWVCEQASFVPSAQSLFFVGSLVGGLLFGWLADRFGRVPALIGSNLIGCIGGIASIYTTGFWDFAFCRFLVGISYDTIYMMIYILVLEYVGPRQRTWVANMSIALYFGGGCLLLPWLAVWLADWRRLLWATSLPMLIVLLAPFLLPESARWLTSRGRVNDAVKILHRFERINGTKIPPDVLDEFVMSSNQTRRTDESMTAVLKSKPLRVTLIIMIMVYMACALIFDALVRMSESLGMDFFITFTLTSATEIPSVTLLSLLLDRWGRRILCSGPMLISGVLSLIAAFVPKGVGQVSLAIVARFCINMSYNTAIQWSTELLPTGVRASGSALVHTTGYLATLLSPFVVYLEHVWGGLPLTLLGGVAVLAAAASALLPETRGASMPQTVADGEALYRQRSLLGKRKKPEEDEVIGANTNQKALIT